MNQDPATELHIVLTQSSLQEVLQEVPEDIRSWFGSEKTTYFIMELNQRLGLQEERARIIPKLLLRLEVKDIHPADFIDTLAQELLISPHTAKPIAEEIKEKILGPIEPSLSDWEINIDLIDTVGATRFPETAPGEVVPVEKEEQKPEKPSFKKATGGEPLILHKEGGVQPLKTTKGAGARKSFSFPLGKFFKQQSGATAAPPQVRIETPKNMGDKSKKRTVHYSEFRTSIPGPIDTNFIDLTKLGPDSKGDVPYTNIESKPPKKKTGDKPKKSVDAGAKLEGNTVDLRNK